MNFSDRNSRIIAMRERGHTLTEIGRQFCLEKERVRQILLKPKLIKEKLEKEKARADALAVMALPDSLVQSRAWICLRNEGIEDFRDLQWVTEWELSRVPNIGTKTLNEIKVALEAHGMGLASPESGTTGEYRLYKIVEIRKQMHERAA